MSKDIHEIDLNFEERLTDKWVDGKPLALIEDGFFVKPFGEDFLMKVVYADIIWIEANNNHSRMHLLASKHIDISANLGGIECMLARQKATKFIRISRYAIVNVERVEKIMGNTLYVKDWRISLEIGKAYRRYTFECFRATGYRRQKG